MLYFFHFLIKLHLTIIFQLYYNNDNFFILNFSKLQNRLIIFYIIIQAYFTNHTFMAKRTRLYVCHRGPSFSI